MSWQAASFGLLVLALGCGFAWYEREKPPARVLALVAVLAALAVVGRLAFAAIPNVKPTTDIVLFAGYALGAVPGFAVGAVTAIVSNVFLSQGPWTLWQMAGWGAVGVGGAVLARVMRSRKANRLVLAAACGLAGLAFGAWMDVYQWTLAARQDLDSYVAVAATSLPYNLAHAIGNVVFCLLIGPAFVRALRRYRRRLEVTWEATPAGAGAAAAALAALALAGGLPGRADSASAAASPSERAVRYLLRAQNRDGGFGGAPGQRSSQLLTGWSGLGLAAAGRNPQDVRPRRGDSIAEYVRRSAGSLADIGEIERTVLLLEAGGLSSRSFAGRDLVARIERRRRGDGSIAGYVSYTAFGILALKAARHSVGSATASWLERAQGSDGGFGLTPRSGADFDMTGAALQALAAARRAGGAVAGKAVDYLRRGQNSDGGFGQMKGRTSNAQSTAYAVQGLVAVHSGGDVVTRAMRYLKRLQRRNGSIRYSGVSSQTPVWVTAQALTALRRKPFPLATVKRRRHSRRHAGAPASVAAAVASPHQAPRPPRRSATAPRLRHGHEQAALPSRVRIDDAHPASAPRRGSPAKDGGGPPTWRVAGAAVVGLAAILGLRVYLRRRRRAASS